MQLQFELIDLQKSSTKIYCDGDPYRAPITYSVRNVKNEF